MSEIKETKVLVEESPLIQGIINRVIKHIAVRNRQIRANEDDKRFNADFAYGEVSAYHQVLCDITNECISEPYVICGACEDKPCLKVGYNAVCSKEEEK